jgi:hypothetical protein
LSALSLWKIALPLRRSIDLWVKKTRGFGVYFCVEMVGGFVGKEEVQE